MTERDLLSEDAPWNVWDEAMPHDDAVSFAEYVRPGMMGPEFRFQQWADIDWLPGEPGWSVLDVGCADATYYPYFRDAREMDYSGCDISDNMLAAGRAAYPEVQFHKGNAAALPFEDAAYDMVFCSDLLLHVPQELERTIVEELCRVAKRVAVVHTRPLIEGPRHEHLRQPAPELLFRYETLDYELALMREIQPDVEQRIRNAREVARRPGADVFFLFWRGP